MRGLRFGRRGFGHLFGLLFLARHPVFLVIVVAVVVGLFLWNRRKR
ncbi:MAG TPA: Loki-CTERM sorting domain-containing protein [Marmoricola sp.]|nr:Loki-CTERM sorting domain-containing protein [Marmoricola sp.]